MNPAQEPSATGIGSSSRDRWRSALGWGGFLLVAAVLLSRVFAHHTTILVLGLLLSAVVFVVVLRTRPAVDRRTIRREGVARVTRSTDSTAFLFRDEKDAIVGLADLHERSEEFREALRRHGWPVGLPEA